jgi:hypothetical protein
MANESIMCEACQMFKPLEMYKNLVHAPESVTDEEVGQLNMRRKQEKQLILDRDMDKLDGNGAYNYWYMISSDWLYRWKCFVSNKISRVSSSS